MHLGAPAIRGLDNQPAVERRRQVRQLLHIVPLRLGDTAAGRSHGISHVAEGRGRERRRDRVHDRHDGVVSM